MTRTTRTAKRVEKCLLCFFVVNIIVAGVEKLCAMLVLRLQLIVNERAMVANMHMTCRCGVTHFLCNIVTLQTTEDDANK